MIHGGEQDINGRYLVEDTPSTSLKFFSPKKFHFQVSNLTYCYLACCVLGASFVAFYIHTHDNDSIGDCRVGSSTPQLMYTCYNTNVRIS